MLRLVSNNQQLGFILNRNVILAQWQLKYLPDPCSFVFCIWNRNVIVHHTLLEKWNENWFTFSFIHRLDVIHFPLQDAATKEKALQTMSSMSSAQIVSASVMHNKASLGLPPPPVSYASAFWQGGLQAGTSQE